MSRKIETPATPVEPKKRTPAAELLGKLLGEA